MIFLVVYIYILNKNHQPSVMKNNQGFALEASHHRFFFLHHSSIFSFISFFTL